MSSGIELRGQRGRADEVAEHHRELAALGVGAAIRRVARGRRLVRRHRIGQIGDGG
jgi:hypothetical protein